MGNRVEILLVEDNPGDVLLTREALADAKVLSQLHVVGDGIEASQFLKRQSPYENAIRPDLILLDLNLPRKNGSELLAEIKEDEDLKLIPVVILTTSEAEEDVLQTYKLHANAYVTKPVGMAQFIQIVRAIDDFWFTIVKLPPSAQR